MFLMQHKHVFKCVGHGTLSFGGTPHTLHTSGSSPSWGTALMFDFYMTANPLPGPGIDEYALGQGVTPVL